MPLSGSYFYPGISTANSSFSKILLNESSSAPSAISGRGTIYVKSSDGLLYYKDDSGNEYTLTASGSDSPTSLTGSVLIPAANRIDVQGRMVNTAGHLILSSSTLASTIVVSGSLVLKDASAIVLAPSGDLILSASNRIVMTGTFISTTTPLIVGTINATTIANSTNTIADHIQFDKANDTYHMRAINGPMILTSSATSMINIRGILKLGGEYTAATLPVGSDALSGNMVWVTDRKCFAGYGPEGWQRLLSGTL